MVWSSVEYASSVFKIRSAAPWENIGLISTGCNNGRATGNPDGTAGVVPFGFEFNRERQISAQFSRRFWHNLRIPGADNWLANCFMLPESRCSDDGGRQAADRFARRIRRQFKFLSVACWVWTYPTGLLQFGVSAVLVEVGSALPDEPTEMLPLERDHVVHHVSACAADSPFGGTIQPG